MGVDHVRLGAKRLVKGPTVASQEERHAADMDRFIGEEPFVEAPPAKNIDAMSLRGPISSNTNVWEKGRKSSRNIATRRTDIVENYSLPVAGD
jgi:hypothetical protein